VAQKSAGLPVMMVMVISFWKHTVAIYVVPQPGAECEGDAGNRNIRDTWPAMLRRCGHHVEPLHAPQISETLTQVGAGIRREDLPRFGHV
jgi:hypothetical protein